MEKIKAVAVYWGNEDLRLVSGIIPEFPKYKPTKKASSDILLCK